MVEDLYHLIFLKIFGSLSPNKDTRARCCNIVTNLLVCLLDEQCSIIVVAEDAFNNPDIANELYLWGVLQYHRNME